MNGREEIIGAEPSDHRPKAKRSVHTSQREDLDLLIMKQPTVRFSYADWEASSVAVLGPLQGSQRCHFNAVARNSTERLYVFS